MINERLRYFISKKCPTTFLRQLSFNSLYTPSIPFHQYTPFEIDNNEGILGYPSKRECNGHDLSRFNERPRAPICRQPPTPYPAFQCLGNGDQMSRPISRFSREHTSSGLFLVYPVLIQISRRPSLPNSLIPSSRGMERRDCRLGVKGGGSGSGAFDDC
ncbi:hypothetical protein NPIL_427591 [Nephila pilipes]|uniref:Uncharacterized protein n=1 Tax=Nephila pilipes TaxID=299642 RepID=A0A8X6NM92_NEPPI|nr:hypothetical protein NPIL_427591 [Nephila pilipes]